MKIHLFSRSGAMLLLTCSLALTGCRSETTEVTVAKPAVVNTNATAKESTPPAPAVAAEPSAELTSVPALGTNVPPDALGTNAPTARIAPQVPELSPAIREVADMVEARVGEAVLLEYVNNSPGPFALSSDEVVYLKDIGVPETVVAAMLRRGGELREQAAETAKAAETPAPPAEAAPAPEPAPTPASTAVYSQTVTPDPGAAAASQPAPVTNNYFYSALSPYGSWLYIEPHGWCWQPTVAVSVNDWRPYLHDGRWLYTTHGWYWQSYYTWGWAPFHYGRWHLSPVCGWVWVPGSDWGPAWVTWRYSDNYCGWAPLPPGCGWRSGYGLTYWGDHVSVGFSFGLSSSWYAFVGWGHFWNPHVYRHCLPRHRTTVVYNHTTIINNYIVKDNTIINNGIPTHRMPTMVRSELRKVELKDLPGGAPTRVRAEQASPDGAKLAVYRPRVPTNLKADPAKPAEPPTRMVRSRSEAPARMNPGLAPERRSSAIAQPRNETITPGRTPVRTGPVTRSETPRNEAPASGLNRSGGNATVTPAVPRRTEASKPGGATTPGRVERRTQEASPGAPSRGVVREPSRAPERGSVPPTRTPSGNTSPNRIERAVPSAPANPPPRTTFTQPLTQPSRYESPNRAPSSRSEFVRPDAPAAPRNFAPSRSQPPVISAPQTPSYSSPPRNSAPSYSAPRSSPPAQSFSSPPPSRSGGGGAPVPSFSAPPSRGSGGGGSAPSFSAPRASAPSAPPSSSGSAPSRVNRQER